MAEVPAAADSAEGKTVEVAVGPEAAGRRLDVFLAGAVAGLSRSRIQALIAAGAVSVGGATIGEAKRPVNAGETVRLAVPPAASAVPGPETIALEIIHEDDDLIVIDKPAGLVVHPGAGNWTGTLVNALLAHCGPSLSGIGGVARPGIVHRLDKDTTGLMVVAKSDRAHAGLSAQFADHGRSGPLEREYLALVWGVPSPARGTIDKPLARSASDRQKMAVVAGGRRAVTHYAVERTLGPPGRPPVASLVACRLETGRTHQIRVHMAAIGHPVIGDPLYGRGFASKAAALPAPARAAVERFGRQALHAAVLGFEHPVTGRTLRFERGLPPDMAALAASLAGP